MSISGTIDTNITGIINKIESLSGEVEGKLVLYFVKKGRTNNYSAYKPSISGELQEELLKLIVSSLKEIKDMDTTDFNPIGSLDETLETCNYDYVESLNDILESTLDKLLPNPPENLSEFSFYLIKIKFDTNSENDFLCFRRVTKFKNLQKGIVGKIFNNEFVKISSDLIGIDSFLDIIGYDKKLTIANHISMERIFDIKAQYEENAKRTLELIKNTGMIDNFDDFYNDSISDGRSIRGLTKILKDPERVNQVHENFEKVVELVANMELEINFNEDKTKMIYENKSQLQKMTFILRDAYYQTFIIERKGLDELA